MEKTIKIGWIGLGNMGIPMATNLLKAGYAITTYNRSRDKEKTLIDVGAISAQNPAAVLASSDIVFTMLSNDAAVKSVFEDTDGLLSSDLTNQRGKLLIDMSTVAPETSRYLASLTEKKGLEFLEAPVSGSVKPAQDGTLLILVGGKTENHEKARPLFEVLGKMSIYLGGPGYGSSAKLANNYLLGLHVQGLAEAILFAQQNGISPENMLTIINEGALGNGLSKLKTNSILQTEFPAAFALKHLVKDLGLAKDAGLDTVLSTPLLNSFHKANEEGLGEEDIMAIIKSLKN
jgi:3-hydroxyisobutyrate dehydrogenase